MAKKLTEKTANEAIVKMDMRNSKEGLVFLFSLIKAMKASKEDNGKIGMEDFANLMIIFPTIGPAIEDAGDIILELKDMDSEEAKDLMIFASAQLGGALSDEELVIKIEKSLKALVALFEAYKAW